MTWDLVSQSMGVSNAVSKMTPSRDCADKTALRLAECGDADIKNGCVLRMCLQGVSARKGGRVR